MACALATGAASTWASGQLGSSKGEPDDSDVFVFSRLQYRALAATQDLWDCGVDKEEDLLEFVRTRTNVKLSKKTFYERAISVRDLRDVYARPDSYTSVYTRPFLFMTGSGKFEFNDPETETLGEYLKRGGFWYVDDCISTPNHTSDFYRIFLREARRIYPGREMEPVPHDHAIYHCAYDVPDGAPWVQGEHLPDMGLFVKNRLVVFLTAVDLHCGWRWEWTNRTKHTDKEICRKMGANIITYALTH
jgi:hypothetical protein